MPEEDILKEEEPSAEGSAQEEWLSTAEATKLVGASARTLKRRADAGALRRSSVYSKFGLEARYNKEDILKLKEELHQRAKGLAEAIAEARAEDAEGKSADPAGGDRGSRALAEASRIFDQKIAKLTEPFFRLADTLETGFDKLLHFQERMVDIETARDRERKEERGEEEKRRREERVKNKVITISYILATVAALAFFGYLFWWMATGGLFEW